MDMCERYEHHFVARGMNSVGHARHYLSGLLGKQRRKNIETIHHDVSQSDYQGMEQFISSSPWCHKALMDQVAQDANALLGDSKETGLFFDESSFLKKGHASVGVQRQWSGRAGKIENCQVAVYGCLGRGDEVAITDFRLYLPESWAQDPERCDKAKIPLEERRQRAKWELALEMVHQAREQNLSYGWIGMDSLYGTNTKLTNALEDLGEKFMGDVHRTVKIWDQRPQLEELQSSSQTKSPKNRGRPRKLPRLHKENTANYLSVEDYRAAHFEKKHRRLCYRQGHKGELWGRFWVKKVWCWELGWARVRERILVVRQDADGSFKYSLSNLPSGRQWEWYAWVQGQRYWIEHAFHEAKSQLGMAQYQVRVWKGWHHHMSLVCLALLFSSKVRHGQKASAPLLSVRDITELLDYYLPRKGRSEKEIMAQIRERHQQRQQDIDRRKRHRVGLPKSN